MRKDMAKMLVETHRHGGSVRYKDRRAKGNDARNFENAPKREKIKERYGWEMKEFGENFPPLIGFLRKNVGRPWDKVYSELCSSLKGGGTIIEHTKVHLFGDFLSVNPHWVDGKPHDIEYSYGGPRPLRPGKFYVDKHGILKVVKQPKRNSGKNKKKTDVYNAGSRKQYRRINGAWFELLIKELPRSPLETRQTYYDVFFKRHIGWQPCDESNDSFWLHRQAEWVWRDYKVKSKRFGCEYTLGQEYPGAPSDRHHYAYEKRQLSSKEIRTFGLK